MPEMPEVETIARRLRKSIVGKRIVEVRLSGLSLRKPVADTFAGELEGRVICKIHRRGKFLIAELQPLSFWLIHLGMSGRIVYDCPEKWGAKHTHAIIRFSDSSELHYVDHRRFGLLAAYGVSRLNQIPELQGLGRDPLGTGFREEWLWPQIVKSKQEIKAFLLDQRVVAGLGNIYVCEALFLAHIHPARRCYTLTQAETRRLRRGIRTTLRAGIRHRGTSFSDYFDSDGQAGENQRFLHVYGREGRRCHRCAARIMILRQGNRSSFFCPHCQPATLPGGDNRRIHLDDGSAPKMSAL